jgi:hypothetical protein
MRQTVSLVSNCTQIAVQFLWIETGWHSSKVKSKVVASRHTVTRHCTVKARHRCTATKRRCMDRVLPYTATRHQCMMGVVPQVTVPPPMRHRPMTPRVPPRMSEVRGTLPSPTPQLVQVTNLSTSKVAHLLVSEAHRVLKRRRTVHTAPTMPHTHQAHRCRTCLDPVTPTHRCILHRHCMVIRSPQALVWAPCPPHINHRRP